VAAVKLIGPIVVVILQQCHFNYLCESHSYLLFVHFHTEIIPYSRIFTEMLNVAQRIKKCCAFCKNLRFIGVS
jgi:hypothetical protein